MDDQNKMNQSVDAAEGGVPQGEQPMEQGGGEVKKPMGPIIGVAIIVIVLILGGLYFWSTQLSKEEMTAEEITAQEDPALIELQKQSDSDEIADIEADLDATDLEGLDAELEQIEQELTL